MRNIIILALSICSCQAMDGNCPRPPLENGFFVPHLETYVHNVTISYGCDVGWKPALQKWWGELTCTDGTWSHIPRCINKTSCITPHVLHAEPVIELEPFYPAGEVVDFKCKPGYEANEGKSTAQCVDGKWSVPVCEKKSSSCVPPPRVENGMIVQAYKDVFEDREQLTYVCAEGYTLKRYNYNICQNGRWTNTIQCARTEAACGAPQVANAVQIGSVTPPYPIGHVQFKCNQGFEFEGTQYAVCEKGQWKLPVCKRSVAGGHKRPETSVVTSPVSECGDQPLIVDGDVVETQSKGQLKVVCKAFFKLVGPEIVRCVAGKWTEIPVCKAPCKLDRTRFLHRQHPDEYLPDGEGKRFYCNYYYRYSIHITCLDGQLSYSACG